MLTVKNKKMARKQVQTLGEMETRDNIKRGRMPGFAEDTSKTNIQKDADANVRKGMRGVEPKGTILTMKYSKHQDEKYDAKMAYNKNLSGKARLHYLENNIADHKGGSWMSKHSKSR